MARPEHAAALEEPRRREAGCAQPARTPWSRCGSGRARRGAAAGARDSAGIRSAPSPSTHARSALLQALPLQAGERGLQRLLGRGLEAALAPAVEIHRRRLQLQQDARRLHRRRLAAEVLGRQLGERRTPRAAASPTGNRCRSPPANFSASARKSAPRAARSAAARWRSSPCCACRAGLRPAKEAGRLREHRADLEGRRLPRTGRSSRVSARGGGGGGGGDYRGARPANSRMSGRCSGKLCRLWSPPSTTTCCAPA